MDTTNTTAGASIIGELAALHDKKVRSGRLFVLAGLVALAAGMYGLWHFSPANYVRTEVTAAIKDAIPSSGLRPSLPKLDVPAVPLPSPRATPRKPPAPRVAKRPQRPLVTCREHYKPFHFTPVYLDARTGAEVLRSTCDRVDA